MPYISTHTNIEITKEKEETITKRLGKAIEIIPGKTEEWLMVSFEDNLSLYFKGKTNQPIAFVEVKIAGSSTQEHYQNLTAAITQIVKEELDITPENCYVRYEETKYWGWNGNNF